MLAHAASGRCHREGPHAVGRKTAPAPSHGSGGGGPQTGVSAGRAPPKGSGRPHPASSGGSRHTQPSLAPGSPRLSQSHPQKPDFQIRPHSEVLGGCEFGEGTSSNPFHRFLMPTQSIDSYGHPLFSSEASPPHTLPRTSLSPPARPCGRFSAAGASVLGLLDVRCTRPRASRNPGPVGGRGGPFHSLDRPKIAAGTSLVGVRRTSWNGCLCGPGIAEYGQFDIVQSHIPFGLWATDNTHRASSLPVLDALRGRLGSGRGLDGRW